MKGAIEDPVLDRALSATGFTTHEELQAQHLETLSALTLMFFKANFEEPASGWPEALRIERPKTARQERRSEPKKAPQASAAEVVSFTEANRVE
jgi:hypothetical protein